MAKAKPKTVTLAELEIELREAFQKARRRLDMLTKFRTLGKVSEEQTDQFIEGLRADDEAAARKVIKIIEVTRG